MGKPFYEKEDPTEVATYKNVFRYYPLAGKLSVSGTMTEDEHGNRVYGKTVTIDTNVLKNNRAALMLFKKALFG